MLLVVQGVTYEIAGNGQETPWATESTVPWARWERGLPLTTKETSMPQIVS